MSEKVKPLLIVKLNSVETMDKMYEHMMTIAEGIKQGAIVIGPQCEVIAFDQNGDCVYPK